VVDHTSATSNETGTLSAVGAASGAALLALDLMGVGGSTMFLLLAVLTLAAVVVGVVRYRPSPRWIWYLLIGAMALFGIGGVLRELFHTLGDLSTDRTLWPEPFSILGYLTLVAMFLGGARARLGRRWRDPNAMLDAAVAGLAALALAWIYLITPAIAQDGIALSTRIALAVYPALSVVVVTIGFRFAFSSVERPPLSFRLMIAAFLATLAGDVVYMLVELGVVANSQWVDLPYGLAYIGVIAAVLHPSMRMVTEPLPERVAAPRRGLALVAAAVCVPGVVMVAQPETHLDDRIVLSVIVLALLACAAARVFRALRDHAISEAKLREQATHDSLTGLPNRIGLEAQLADLAHGRRPGDGPLALLLLDLDRFKLVNDTLGHDVGDDLLRAVAARLSNNVRPDDIVSRVGGNEFAVVLPAVRDEVEATEMADRTRLTFMTPFHAGGGDITASVSVGIAILATTDADLSPTTLLRDADTAMFAAKDAGGDTVVLFDSEMHERVSRRAILERSIRGAHERGELSLEYQPVVQIADGRMTGLEALLRWDHPELGRVPPVDFIPICEEIGYIVELGAWVFDEAAHRLARLRDEVPHTEQLSMAINVSALQLRDTRLCDHVARALLKYALPPESLCLEITESLLVENLRNISDTLETLRGFGVRIVIDDFATGYSSLAYLRRLPFDEIKIDRQFISHLGEDHADNTLVAAMLAMANSLEATSIAEGIETQDQVERLVELGCHHAQGFLFGRPVASDRVESTIERLGLAAAPRLRVVRNPA
jgi:diguanylate cyclase (GGDEF)-like protein